MERKEAVSPVFGEARWICAPGPDHRQWDEYDIELELEVLSGGVDLLFGVGVDGGGSGCALDCDAGTAALFALEGGERREWGSAVAPELAAGREAIETQEAREAREVLRKTLALRIERHAAAVAVYINGRRTLAAVEPNRRPGSIGFKTGDGQAVVIRKLRVAAPDGRTLYVNRFYDPAAIQFSGGRIDGSGCGLRLEAGELALCEAPISPDSPLLRQAFELASPVVRASMRVYALGWYELRVNGAKADDRVLAPANSPYAHRLLYDEYDVTGLLREGGNAVGLWLGNGYNMNYSRWGWKWRREKAAIAELTITLADGTTRTIATDESWLTAPSPLLANDMYDGETYDAHMEQSGWDTYGFDASAWTPAAPAEPPEGGFAKGEQPPLKTFEPLRPVRIVPGAGGAVVYDFGQNIAGWTRIKVRGPAGARIALRHSELVDAEGRIDPWTNRNAAATDVYIMGGRETENYEPRFTYHGFRYVETSGDAELLDIAAVPVHSDVGEAGSFLCSDPVLSRLQRSLRWSILNNLYSIPTDCCQRDERTPCLMDSAVVEEAAIHNFDMRSYYRKWLGDIRHDAGNPDWSGDKVTLPWHLYQYYEDRDILEASYPSIAAYVGLLAEKHPSGIVEEGFGDWCAPNEDGWDNYFNEVAIVNTALYWRLASVAAEAAGVCGRSADQARFAKLADSILEAFDARFHDGQGKYGSGSQTAQIMPLALGMVPEARTDDAYAALLAAIEAKGGGLDTGIYGTRYLLDVLADRGDADLALEMLTRPEYPSFGNQIAQGATTLWEQWSARGGMHSHDHAMFGGVGASFYTRLGGIAPLAPGYAKIRVKPVFPARLDWIEARLDTVRGTVACSWRREGAGIRVEVDIPEGADACIVLPASLDRGAVLIEREAGPGRHRFTVADSAVLPHGQSHGQSH